MSLLFGRLTQNFVNFAMSLGSANDPQTQAEQLHIIAVAFKHAAALNASYLSYIGQSACCKLSLISPAPDRCWHVCLHIRLYVDLGVYR